MNPLTYFISVLSTIFTLVVSNVWALPNCPYKGTAYWTNCQGTYTNANGNKYVGEWQNDKWHGQGIRNLANGDKYVGGFRKRKAYGQGTFTFASGKKWTGEWDNNKLNGPAIKYNQDGSIYQEGFFKDDKLLYTQKKN